MKLGFIGLGDMGFPIAKRLLAGGHGLIVWNRSPQRIAELVALGAEKAELAKDVIRSAEVIGLCLTSHEAAEAVAFGPNGLLSQKPPADRVVVDFSTGSPEKARQFAARAARLACAWVDAPVSGGPPAAAEGRLTILVGGDPGAVAKAEPMFKALAARVSHLGPSGSGQAAKMCNQLIVACNLLAIAEALALARRVGMDVARVPQALEGGFADSKPLQIFGPRMAAHAFEPRLGGVGLMRKDVRLALDLARQAGSQLPLLEQAAAIYDRAERDVGTESDISRLIELYESVSERR